MRLIEEFWIILRGTFISAYQDGLIDTAKVRRFLRYSVFFRC